MARANPNATVTLRAKIDTLVTNAIARNTASEPRIANPPTATGSAAASNPPKTHTSAMKLSGIAMISIRSRSLSVCWLTCS